MRPTTPSERRGVVLGVLLALLAVDAALVLLFLSTAVGPGPPDPALFDDGGVAEWFGHAKVAVTVGLLVVVAVRTGQAVFAAWAVLLALVVLDDALMLHEIWGARLAGAVDLPVVAGLRAQDTGELVVWAAMGLLPAVAVIVTHLRSDESTRRRSRRIGYLFAALLVVAVLLDVLVVATGPSLASAVLALGEDGGELVVMTLLLAYVLLVGTEPAADGGVDDRAHTGPPRRGDASSTGSGHPAV